MLIFQLQKFKQSKRSTANCQQWVSIRLLSTPYRYDVITHDDIIAMDDVLPLGMRLYASCPTTFLRTVDRCWPLPTMLRSLQRGGIDCMEALHFRQRWHSIMRSSTISMVCSPKESSVFWTCPSFILTDNFAAKDQTCLSCTLLHSAREQDITLRQDIDAFTNSVSDGFNPSPEDEMKYDLDCAISPFPRTPLFTIVALSALVMIHHCKGHSTLSSMVISASRHSVLLVFVRWVEYVRFNRPLWKRYSDWRRRWIGCE